MNCLFPSELHAFFPQPLFEKLAAVQECQLAVDLTIRLSLFLTTKIIIIKHRLASYHHR